MKLEGTIAKEFEQLAKDIRGNHLHMSHKVMRAEAMAEHLCLPDWPLEEYFAGRYPLRGTSPRSLALDLIRERDADWMPYIRALHARINLLTMDVISHAQYNLWTTNAVALTAEQYMVRIGLDPGNVNDTAYFRARALLLSSREIRNGRGPEPVYFRTPRVLFSLLFSDLEKQLGDRKPPVIRCRAPLLFHKNIFTGENEFSRFGLPYWL